MILQKALFFITIISARRGINIMSCLPFCNTQHWQDSTSRLLKVTILPQLENVSQRLITCWLLWGMKCSSFNLWNLRSYFNNWHKLEFSLVIFSELVWTDSSIMYSSVLNYDTYLYLKIERSFSYMKSSMDINDYHWHCKKPSASARLY